MIYFILVLTILNSFEILHRKYFSLFYISKHKSSRNKVLLGFHLMFKVDKYSSKSILYIPIRNSDKISRSENLERLKSDKTNQVYNINAEMSWLNTKEELDEYRNTYREVNPKAVDEAYERYLEKIIDVN